MRLPVIPVFFSLCSLPVSAQTINDSINKKEAESILTYLASDELKGRVNYSREQLHAAEFLSQKFTGYNLQTFPGCSSFYFPFSPVANETGTRENITWNEKKLEDSSFIYIGHSLPVKEMELRDFLIIESTPPLNDSVLYQYWRESSNILVWIKQPGNTGIYPLLKNVRVPAGIPTSEILMVTSPGKPGTLKISENKKFTSSVLYNIIGVLRGKSKPDEAIIFSAHYDHVDRGIDGIREGIFNGANDDASGTTAVLMLAKYFSTRNDNERTIIFCLFAGEELGLLGSRAFVDEVNPGNIKALINIEMIGIPGYRKNSFFLTGAEHSDVFKILKRNLNKKGTSITYDPVPQHNLFKRSDNYPFALKGIPAHSVMCSDDTYSCYHQTCDDAGNIDFENMTLIVQAIAQSCRTLINGSDSPRRAR